LKRKKGEKMKKLILVFALLLLLTLACNLPNQNNGENELPGDGATTQVSGNENQPEYPQPTEDQQADPQPEAPTETPEDIYNTGTVEGKVCFPSEYIPAMYLYLANVNTQETTIISIPENQGNFSGGVPEGTYTAYAWLADYTMGGTYSEAVLCGLSIDCSDHSLVEFEVIQGETTSGIEVCDWYGGPSDVPVPPGIDFSDFTGSISGELGYPSEGIPPLQIVAFNLGNQQFYYIEVPENTFTYAIDNLPAGSYTVVAYPSGENFGGGYSEFVPCGQTADCTDHSLITVQVSAGQTTTGVNPVDFYAPAGAFPDNPVP
jgi:hypothetical protein